jgi:hypothetical protein
LITNTSAGIVVGPWIGLSERRGDSAVEPYAASIERTSSCQGVDRCGSIPGAISMWA